MIGDSDIRQFTCDVWATVLGLDLTPTGGAFAPAAPTLAGRVDIAGAWHGAVVVVCPVPLANRAAEVMFALAPGAVTAEDARDALGEVANILGGNIKAMLPGPSHLSLPTVAAGTADAARPADHTRVAEAVFDCEGQPFLLAVVRDCRARESVAEDEPCLVGG